MAENGLTQGAGSGGGSGIGSIPPNLGDPPTIWWDGSNFQAWNGATNTQLDTAEDTISNAAGVLKINNI